MHRLRALAVLLLALLPITAAAQVDFDFYRWWDGEMYEGDSDVVVQSSSVVKAHTLVNWSYSFPSVGISESGTMSFEPGSTFDRFQVQYPQDGAYHPLLHGSATISYGSTTKTKEIYIRYQEPWVIVDELRCAEADDEQAVTVRLGRPSSVAISLAVSADGGSATEGSDFALIDGSVTFGPFATQNLVRFLAPKDGLTEGTETFRIHVQSASFNAEPYIYRGSGTVSIDDAEVTAVPDVATHDAFTGQTFDIGVSLSRALHPSRALTVVVETSNAAVARPLDDSITLAAGATSISVPVEAGSPGSATIRFVFPNGYAVEPASAEVNVFGGEITFEKREVVLRKKEQVTTTLRIAPAPPRPLELGLELSQNGIVRIDTAASFDETGGGSVTFTGQNIGTVEVSVVTTPGGAPLATVIARVIDVFSAKSIAPSSGSTLGGTPVTLTGSGFAGDCTVRFDGRAATNVTVVDQNTLRAIAPARPAGKSDVTVACDGFAQMLPGAFEFKTGGRARAVRH